MTPSELYAQSLDVAAAALAENLRGIRLVADQYQQRIPNAVVAKGLLDLAIEAYNNAALWESYMRKPTDFIFCLNCGRLANRCHCTKEEAHFVGAQ